MQRDQTDAIVDFEFKFQKYLRHFYNISIGYKYMQYLEEPRQAIDGVSRDKFAIKGIKLSVQNFLMSTDFDCPCESGSDYKGVVSFCMLVGRLR